MTVEQTQAQRPSGFSVDGIGRRTSAARPRSQRIVDILQTSTASTPAASSEFTVQRATATSSSASSTSTSRQNHQLIAPPQLREGHRRQLRLAERDHLQPAQHLLRVHAARPTRRSPSSTARSAAAGTTSCALVYTTHPRQPRRARSASRPSRSSSRTARRSSRARERFSHGQRLDQDSFELTDDFTFYRGQPLVHGRHPQRVLPVREPVHPGPLRHVPVQQRRLPRPGPGAGLRPQLLAHRATRWSRRQVRRQAVGLLRGRPVEGQAELHADPGRAPRHAALRRHARSRTRAPSSSSATRRTWCPRPTQFSPRLGFNWDVTGDGKNQVRGGIGVFTGRTPYVWLSNQFSGHRHPVRAASSVTRNAANRIPFDARPRQPAAPQVGNAAAPRPTSTRSSTPTSSSPRCCATTSAYDRDLDFGGLSRHRRVPLRGHHPGDPLPERQPRGRPAPPRSTGGRPSRASTRRPQRAPTC